VLYAASGVKKATTEARRPKAGGAGPREQQGIRNIAIANLLQSERMMIIDSSPILLLLLLIITSISYYY
jgi:hypothetical protein